MSQEGKRQLPCSERSEAWCVSPAGCQEVIIHALRHYLRLMALMMVTVAGLAM